MVIHSPSLTLKEAQLAERSIRTERLSVESLLVHTIYVRTRARLTELKTTVQERLQQLPATPYEQLPLTYDLKTHPLSKLASKQQTMFIKLHKQPMAVLVVEFSEKVGSECEIQYNYYFLLTKPCSIEDDPLDDTIVKDIPKVYMKALGMVEFDPFLVTHGSTTKVDVQELSEKIIGKRKPGGKVEAPIKRTRFPAYFISDLAHVVSFADERIPFTCLEQELSRQGCAHSGTVVESNSVGLAITIVKFPPVPGLESR